MPLHARPVVSAIDDEIVALRLHADGVVDGGCELSVVGGGAKRPAQVGSVLVAEAGMQRSGAGDPHAVARLAEIVRHRRDEAELAAGLADADITRRTAGIIVEIAEGE